MKRNIKKQIQMQNAINKAVIFARVSSSEQKDNNSIDAQMFKMKEYCVKKNYEVIKEIRLVESSTRGDREQFYEMIDFIKKQKEPIALICDAVDRLRRSFKEVPVLEELRVAGKLTLHFLRENQVLDKKANAAQLMAYHMFVMMAASFANSISDNVKRGFQEIRLTGEIKNKNEITKLLLELGYMHSDIDSTKDLTKDLAEDLTEDDIKAAIYNYVNTYHPDLICKASEYDKMYQTTYEEWEKKYPNKSKLYDIYVMEKVMSKQELIGQQI